MDKIFRAIWSNRPKIKSENPRKKSDLFLGLFILVGLRPLFRSEDSKVNFHSFLWFFLILNKNWNLNFFSNFGNFLNFLDFDFCLLFKAKNLFGQFFNFGLIGKKFDDIYPGLIILVRLLPRSSFCSNGLLWLIGQIAHNWLFVNRLWFWPGLEFFSDFQLLWLGLINRFLNEINLTL